MSWHRRLRDRLDGLWDSDLFQAFVIGVIVWVVVMVILAGFLLAF